MAALEMNFNKDTISARNIFAIVPNDANELTFVTRAVYVGTAGDLAVLGADDTAPITFKAVPAGTRLDICVRKVLATNTTASNIVGMR